MSHASQAGPDRAPARSASAKRSRAQTNIATPCGSAGRESQAAEGRARRM